MILRALALLFLFVVLSIAATMYFGQEVLIALGLILTQSKILAKKLVQVEVPLVLIWLKTQASMFFRVELIKKWLMTVVLPLVLGKALLRRIARFTDGYRRALRMRYVRLLRWYRRLSRVEKILATLILVFATLALSVSSLGLWLILFSVKIPLWFAAVATALGRMIWTTVSKMAFKAVAFFQLALVWRAIRRILPERWLQAKRRFDYRVARSVIRRRKMTWRQLEARKESLPFRMGLLLDYLTGGK